MYSESFLEDHLYLFVSGFLNLSGRGHLPGTLPTQFRRQRLQEFGPEPESNRNVTAGLMCASGNLLHGNGIDDPFVDELPVKEW